MQDLKADLLDAQQKGLTWKFIAIPEPIQNLGPAGALALRGVESSPDARRAALAEAGLEKRRSLPARRLSAGQRRRIGLARLALDPAPIWILDEPLTALDDDGQALFARLLSRHLDRGGLALLATHHDLAPAPARVLRVGA